jgi:hypothetical protein
VLNLSPPNDQNFGTEKEIVLNECRQGTPPVLAHNLAVSLDCCVSEKIESCANSFTGGEPLVPNSAILLSCAWTYPFDSTGEQCDGSTESDIKSVSD